MQFSWVILLPLALAGICPMEKHQVCNDAYEDLQCICSVSADDDTAVPFQSCNSLIQLDEETEEDEFPSVTIQFKLDALDNREDFPEEEIRETIATSLRVEEEDIVIFRASCKNTEDELTIQFGILKKDTNDTEIPYSEDDFVDAESVATRMKAMGHLSKIADLEVDEIVFSDTLEDIEFEPDNTELILQAAFLVASLVVMFGLGIYKCVRGRSYSDELQKA